MLSEIMKIHIRLVFTLIVVGRRKCNFSVGAICFSLLALSNPNIILKSISLSLFNYLGGYLKSEDNALTSL